MTHTRARGQCRRSLCSKVRVETDGRTDGRTETIALLTRSVNVGIASLYCLACRFATSCPKSDG